MTVLLFGFARSDIQATHCAKFTTTAWSSCHLKCTRSILCASLPRCVRLCVRAEGAHVLVKACEAGTAHSQRVHSSANTCVDCESKLTWTS